MRVWTSGQGDPAKFPALKQSGITRQMSRWIVFLNGNVVGFRRLRNEGCLDRVFRAAKIGVLCLGWFFALRVEGQQAATPPNPATIFRAAKQALETGDLKKAESGFLQVIALDPDSAAAYVDLAVAYMREKRWDDAVSHLRLAEVRSPKEAGIPLNLGLAYYRKSDFEAAIAPLTTALQLAPNSKQARYLLGLCYFFTNKYKETTEALAPLWPTEAANLNYLYVLSIAASKAGDQSLQQQAFQQMLAIGRDTPEFHLYVGKAYLAEENLDKALVEFKSAAAARADLPLVHYFLGRVYLQQRNFALAEVEFQKDIAVEPDFAYNYEELAMIDATREQQAQAEQHFHQAIDRNKALVNSYFGLAKLYRDGGRYREALAMLDEAERLAPQSASVHFSRGQVLIRTGKTVEGRKELDTAAKLLKSFNDRLQSDPLGNQAADAQQAAQQ